MTDVPKSRKIRSRTAKAVSSLSEAELVLPFGMWKQIREYLFSDVSREYACYLLCGHVIRGTKLRLLGCFLVLPEAEDYVANSLASVQLKRSLLAELLRECGRLGLSLIDLHSHPFATSQVSFSAIDDADEQEKAEWFAQHLPNCVYGSVVLGRHAHNARVRCANGKLEQLPLVIRSLDVPLLLGKESAVDNHDENFVERHVRAFGDAGQKQMSKAHIGIVGLGGLGSGIALGLARLGIGSFTLIDPDRVEKHNLNRLSGMTAGLFNALDWPD